MKKILVVLLVAFSSSLFSYCNGQQGGIGFDSLSSGMTSPGAYVLALAMKDSSISSHLYAGGHFSIAGRNTAINVAEWLDSDFNQTPDIGRWAALGSGVDSDVCALQMFNNYLYAGGKFDTAGGIASSHIARWDTAALKWDSLKGKLNGNVYALCVYKNALYVGGDFTIADGDTVNRIATWNGSAWVPVGAGFNTGAVYALAVSNDTLFAGGSFLKSGGVVVNHIAKLTGNTWGSLGSGTNNTVYALADFRPELYIGGAFTQAGGSIAHYISSFDDYNTWQWRSLEPGVNDTVRALNAGVALVPLINKKQVSQGFGGGNVLVIGGNFDSAGGFYSNYIAALDGSWIGISSLNGPVFALANPYTSFSQGSIENYIGGRFSRSNIDTLNNIAYAYINLGGGVPSLTDKSNVVVYPNPSNGNFTLTFSHPELVSGSQTIEVYNVLGEKVYSQFIIPNSSFIINLSSQPNGIYLYRVITEDGNLMGEGKLVIER
jgi:hypothetical protein